MNTSDLLVRIERIIGNINPKKRSEVESLIASAIESAIANAPAKTISVAFTSEEIALIRDSMGKSKK